MSNIGGDTIDKQYATNKASNGAAPNNNSARQKLESEKAMGSINVQIDMLYDQIRTIAQSLQIDLGSKNINQDSEFLEMPTYDDYSISQPSHKAGIWVDRDATRAK